MSNFGDALNREDATELARIQESVEAFLSLVLTDAERLAGEVRSLEFAYRRLMASWRLPKPN